MNTLALRVALTAVPPAAEPTAPWLTLRGLVPVPPASLGEARSLRDALAGLLTRERAAAADFLVALADFDRRRGWEALGHASLFAFLHRELGLSKGAAYLRFTAARLLPLFPEVEVALRDGRLCVSAVGELSRVLTPENQAEVLPRFFGCSSREAREVAAALVPRIDPPRREVVTVVRAREVAPERADRLPAGVPTAAGAPEAAPMRVEPATPPIVADTVEPLDARQRRLHLTVSRRLLDKVAAAKDALSHAQPGATTEQVLEAALDLLLEREARRRALVKRPRESPTLASMGRPAADVAPVEPPRRDRAIPAAVEREVRLRDRHRCQCPLDSGGVCGETRRLELHHIVPVALGGASTADNLRLTCSFHNLLEAKRALGEAAARQRRRR